MNTGFTDLSSNNSGFDAAPYRAAGHVLVAIKATQGVTYVDPRWAPWAKDAHTNHLCVLHYHFADSSSTGAVQADYFLDKLVVSGVYLEKYDSICVDIEQAGQIADPVKFRQEFDERCIERGHRNLIVYSDAGFLEKYGPGLRPRSGLIWEAAYPKSVKGWWKPWAHQFADNAVVKGVTGPADVSRLNTGAYLWRRIHHP